MQTIGSPLMWSLFAAFVLVALLVDFFAMSKQGAHRVSTREAAIWSLIWVAVSFVFMGWMWWYLGGASSDEAARATAQAKSLEYLTGYLIEKALAVDNIFVFMSVFALFGVPEPLRKRALVIGIIGAIVLRTVMILAGALLIQRFHGLLYVFGAFLVLVGARSLMRGTREHDFSRNPILGLLHWRIPFVTHFDGERLFTTHNGIRAATPLLLAVVMIGVTDVIFAVDSIPAILVVTHDPFVVVTSNLFAIMGLRAIYFLLAGLADRFRLLGTGLAFVMIFIGMKMLLDGIVRIPIAASLGVIGAIVAIAVAASWLAPPAREPDAG